MVKQAFRTAHRFATNRRTVVPLLVAAVLLLAACSSEQPQPPPEQEPEAAMEETEPEQGAAEEGQAEGEEMAAAEEPPQDEAMAPEPEPEPEPMPPPEPPQQAETRWDEAFPEDFEPAPMVRIAVLSHPQRLDQGRRVALLLSKFQKKRLERELGKKVKVVYVSEASEPHGDRSVIRYRKEHLKAAIRVAAAMPREQLVEPMSVEEEAQVGVDLIVYVGEAVR